MKLKELALNTFHFHEREKVLHFNLTKYETRMTASVLKQDPNT